MRVLHLIENLRGGGANRGVFAAAKYSNRFYQHEHTIIPVRSDGGAATNRGLAMARHSEMRPAVFYDWQTDKAMKAAFHAEIAAADVVLIHWWGSNYLWGLRYCNMPPCRLGIIYHVAGTAEADLNENIITAVELGWPDINIAASRYTYDRVFAGLPEERKAFVLAGGGGDFERFTCPRDPIPHEGFRVGLTCSLAFNKLHRQWVHMSIATDMPDAVFVACGSGRHHRTIEAEAEELAPGRFEFKGFLEDDDYGSEMRTWDAMGYPTIRDAAPVGLQEAMWFGVPPIVFKHTAPAYMVEDFETGLLVNSGQEYIQALEYLYHNPTEQQRLSANARTYAERYFGAHNSAPALEDVLQRLASLPKRPHYSQTQKRQEGLP